MKKGDKMAPPKACNSQKLKGKIGNRMEQQAED